METLRSAEQDLKTTKDQLKSTEQKLAGAEQKLEESQSALDRIKSGKLMRFGISGGVGPAFYAPLYSKPGTSVPGVGALTYVMFHPFYWNNQTETNIYCANVWAGKDSQAAAINAADRSAREKAEKIADSLIERAKADDLADAYEALDVICTEYSPNCLAEGAAVRKLAKEASTAGDEKEVVQKRTHARNALIDRVQRTTVDWSPGIPGKCGGRRFFGLWAGYPLKFTATVPTTLGDQATMRTRVDVTPIFAAGYGISPNAYVSILAGISLGKTNFANDNDDELVTSFVFGIGGNLDLLTLFK